MPAKGRKGLGVPRRGEFPPPRCGSLWPDYAFQGKGDFPKRVGRAGALGPRELATRGTTRRRPFFGTQSRPRTAAAKSFGTPRRRGFSASRAERRSGIIGANYQTDLRISISVPEAPLPARRGSRESSSGNFL